ncbi:superfamily II DNA/RNA helicase [Mumia flava]|uniref:RNA helicase n=1 Tax=Mumia flava TaxID=1348852 RepID=A0A2M9BFD0_9ACTN|nr:DEAD/DEAH box helicase [Mumia flava]PJJ56657.1 superfamily II DNA/RNA helicase [Mumia flava]
MGVLPEIADSLADLGITHPFPIQEMTLPIALLGNDLIGQARTGTGKTLAFAIPVVQRTVVPHDPEFEMLGAPGKPQALIVAPTRELAIQVSGDVSDASTKRGARVLTVYGGVPYEPQLEALETGVEIVIGTPGRLLDLAKRKALDLSHVKSLVLDEADEMLDLGFLPDVEALIARTPELRQTMLFSATMPGAIVSLARTHMRHPVNIRAESSSDSQTVPATAQFVYQAHDLDKPEIVARVLQAEDRGRIVVFTRTKRASQRLADDLAERGFNAAPLHGDMAQGAREKAMARFRDGKIDALVATDVAARGIDVENVTHVINYSCPEDDKTYVHRIGRTGRAGKSGIAITLVDWSDVARWKTINKTLGLPFDEPVETYSTSEMLYHDLGIPSEAKGRIAPPKERERSEGSRDRSAGGSDRPKRTRNRSRSRTRGGRPVDRAETGDATPSAEVAAPVQDGSSPESGAANGEGGQTRRRRRRRRRPSGAANGEAPSSGGDAAAVTSDAAAGSAE